MMIMILMMMIVMMMLMYYLFFRLLKMQHHMSSLFFDILIVGAGAYGLPLGAYAKGMGKIAIVLGGNLGPLFGLKGGRFDSRPE